MALMHKGCGGFVFEDFRSPKEQWYHQCGEACGRVDGADPSHCTGELSQPPYRCGKCHQEITGDPQLEVKLMAERRKAYAEDLVRIKRGKHTGRIGKVISAEQHCREAWNSWLQNYETRTERIYNIHIKEIGIRRFRSWDFDFYRKAYERTDEEDTRLGVQLSSTLG